MQRPRRRGCRRPSTVHVEAMGPSAAPSPPAAAPRHPNPSLVIVGPPANGVSSAAARGALGKVPSTGGVEGPTSRASARPTGKSRPTDRIDPRRRHRCAHRVMGCDWSHGGRSGDHWLATYDCRTDGVDKYGEVFRRRTTPHSGGAMGDDEVRDMGAKNVHPGQFEGAEHDGGG